MGKKVNVVLPSGQIVSVDEELAAQTKLSGTTHEQDAAIAGRQIDKARADNITTPPILGALPSIVGEGGAASYGEGFADAASFGLYGKAAGLVNPDYAHEMALRAEEHPYLHGAGELTSVIVPTGGPGLAGKAGKAVEAAMLAREAQPLTRGAELLAQTAGRATEGFIIGAGSHVASTNVTGDPLTIEGTLASAGVGAVLNVGMGAAADKITGLGLKSKTLSDEARSIKGDIDIVNEAREKQLFSRPPDSWESLKVAIKGASDDEQRFTKQAWAQSKKYHEFASGQGLRSEITKTETAINKISKRWKMPGELDDSVNGKMPISEEMQDTLKDWRRRLRRIDQFRNGGFDVEATETAGRWVKDPNIQADPARAVEELRALRSEMERFPKATRTSNWKDLPDMPPKDIPELEPLRVPKDFDELHSMGSERAARLSKLIDSDPRTQEAFQRLAKDLDLNAADGLVGLNAKLGKYISADKRLAAAARAEFEKDNADGLLPLLRRVAKKFVRAGSARAADAALGGGWLGIAGRVGAGEGVGAAMNKAEDAISGAMMRGRLQTQSVLGSMFSKAAPSASKAVRELGPITAYLQQNLITGEDDKDDDLSAAAVRRINEARQAAGVAPDAAFIALQAVMGHPSDAAFKMHQKIIGDTQHLMNKAPKDPGIAFHMLQSDWSPSQDEAIEYAYRIEAVKDPIAAVLRSISGDGHPAATETLWERWPALMQAATGELLFAMPELKLTIDQASHYSQLFRTPITGLMDPEVGMTLQGIYMQSAAPAQNGGPAPSKAPTGNPVGRPAAVQSPIAGSSVAGLL